MMNTQEYLLEKYGMIMTVPEICEFLRIPYQTFMNRRAQKVLGFNTWRDGTKVYAMSEDLAIYLESKRLQG